jgi:aldehyde:ferredoxin oxidoreductase
LTADELRATAQRIVTARKHFNIVAGWTPAEDTLPARFLNQPLADDARAALSADRLAAQIEAYNAVRGWTADGWLPEEQTADVMDRA